MSKVKSAAEYLKEFEDFYKDENQEKFEEETEEEKVPKEEEETARSAPLVGPYIGPPDPLDLCEELGDALAAAEDRIAELEAGATESTMLLTAALDRISQLEKQVTRFSTSTSTSTLSSPPSSPPPPPSPCSLPITPPKTPSPRRQHPAPAPALTMELEAAASTLADLQVIVQRCTAAVHRSPPPCRHHLARRCWFGPAGTGCRFAHPTLTTNRGGTSPRPRRARPPTPGGPAGKSAPPASASIPSSEPYCAVSLPRSDPAHSGLKEGHAPTKPPDLSHGSSSDKQLDAK